MKAQTMVRILVASVLTAALAITASAAFAKKNTYAGQFTDVKDTSWYAKEVSSAYELGFVEGVSDTQYSPDTTVTVAQGITMASRVHAEYNGKSIESKTDGGKWYQMYVDYAMENGIITNLQFDDYTREIKRFEMAELFHDAMGAQYFTAINKVKHVPDVNVGAMYKDKILTLYNAGVLTGNDKYGTFTPNASIKRSECAAIINRVALPENRKTVALEPFTSGEAYQLVYNVGMSSTKEGIASGWVLDNRGGGPKTTHAGFGTLGDVSTEYETAYIREFNYIAAGKLVFEASITCVDNGGFISYRDIDGNDVYTLKIIDGKWNVVDNSGNKPVADATGRKLMRITVDLATGKSETIIDGSAAVAGTLMSDNILGLYIGIDEKGTGAISIGEVNIVVNYAANDNFDLFGADAAYGWETVNADHSTKQLNIKAGGSAKKSFSPVSGTSITEFYLISRDGKDYSVNIGDALKMDVVGKKLTVNGQELYTMTQNMWYRFRVDVNSAAGTAKIWLNGRVLATVALTAKTDVAYFAVNSTGLAVIDNLKVYKEVIPEDYVAAPTTKANLDDYITAMNICSLWRNGTHYGWACITPYDEPTPLIGYYDEGVPETADWEIKYMVEHGVDAQAFCWYSDVATGPIKQPDWGAQLHDGFMYAKYSDYMKYMIQWEVAASASTTTQQFRNYIVPFWFENYFLDDRYLKIDNQLVLGVYSIESLAKSNYFGSAANVKAEFKYLDDKAKEYGFDGVIFLASGDSPTVQMKNMGFDGQYAYSWSRDGRKPEVNMNKIKGQAANAAKQGGWGVPTVSVGFDDIPWHGTRIGLITKEDHKSVLEWLTKEHLPSVKKDMPDWADKFIWISTWNEFGEGTYIQPGGQNGDGFGYLDNIRDVLTDLPEAHTHTLPTAHQAERINHLYPQYARLLRRQGYYDYTKTAEIKKNEAKNKLFINDIDVLATSDVSYYIPPVVKDGKVFYPFNPINAFNYVMGIHYEWRKDVGTLKVMGHGHELVFEVGNNMYLKDGKWEYLGYTLELLDGVPMMDFAKLATDLGYKTETKDIDLYIYTDTYESVWKAANENKKTGDWQFNGYDSEGWESTDFEITTGGGVMTMTTNGNNDRDPISRWNNNSFPDDFYTKKFTDLEIKVRYNYNAGGAHSIVFYYVTDIDDAYNAEKSIKFQMHSTDSQGEWITFKTSLADLEPWQSATQLTGLRLDPFDTSGTMEFDYIKFIEDPGFKYVPPVKEEFSIKNGDAEGEGMYFGSDSANISIIEDPANKKNHVYYVKADPGATFITVDYKAEFEAGETYLIEYDIKLVGNNMPSANAKGTNYVTNLRYPDKENASNNSMDHLIRVGSGTNTPNELTIGDDWLHYTAVHTVKTVDNNKNHTFRIYTDPENGAGFDFYIDNVVCRKMSYEEKAKMDPASVFSWEKSKGTRFKFDNGAEGWQLDGFDKLDGEKGMLTIKSTNGDPKIVKEGLRIDSKKCVAVAIRFKAEKFDYSKYNTEMFFTTSKDGSFSQSKNAVSYGEDFIYHDDGFYTVVFNCGANELWKDSITAIRFDPANVNDDTFYIDEIMFVEI